MSETSAMFDAVLEMAAAAKRGNVMRWTEAKTTQHQAEGLAFMNSVLLGVLIENDAVRRGVHPADAWAQLRAGGLADFG
ncbi:hypothetical protein [Rhodococcus maanshanensis]|uniref:Uncharacterized protein n=1 Tax=Rhodococcus maanshanensis TaxID=183556 RepID=A0A1H7NKV5_9NOCA|nr:hypothetical protein [Rhodococcus maanshanensis]SEL24180.1 hypothetical protein SAMN05444583_10771 [Rhodococcus maanshanensis]